MLKECSTSLFLLIGSLCWPCFYLERKHKALLESEYQGSHFPRDNMGTLARGKPYVLTTFIFLHIFSIVA